MESLPDKPPKSAKKRPAGMPLPPSLPARKKGKEEVRAEEDIPYLSDLCFGRDDYIHPIAATEDQKPETGEPDDVRSFSECMVKALSIRQQYMSVSMQRFPESASHLLDRLTKEGDPPVHKPDDRIPLPGDRGYHFQMIGGVMRVYRDSDGFLGGIPIDFVHPNLTKFHRDLKFLLSLIEDGPLNAISSMRLRNLESKYEKHTSLNGHLESASQRNIVHKDFYNVMKVDNHIHASSSMTQMHLLRFMKRKLETNGDDIVHKTPEGIHMTLSEVFEELKVTADDLNADLLDVHADKGTFGDFKKFNDRFSPMGKNHLRDIFLKTDNSIRGLFFAELVKEVLLELEEHRFQSAELRLSIYGRTQDEWTKLALWISRNHIHSGNVSWIIQVPRLYNEHKLKGYVRNFQELLENIFTPLFEISADPSANPELHELLSQVSGFDLVDDESNAEDLMINKDDPSPENWFGDENPSYAYYCYFIFANIVVLNQLRSKQGLSTFVFRPHCGESGPLHHLATGFLTGESISHGIQLKESPVLQYLYYLARMGIAMSPISNNALFLKYNENPLPNLFQRGLLVSVSTDDPLQFHLTRDPLMEEFATAAHIFGLSSVDLCELARNSVLMCNFPNETKQEWLGPEFESEKSTNLPNIRIRYREDTMMEELKSIENA